MTKRTCLACLAALAGLSACGGDDASSRPDADIIYDADAAIDLPAASEDWTRDLIGTDLQLDLAAMTGVATIEIAASDSTGLSLEVGDLDIQEVSLGADAGGAALDSAQDGAQLDVGVPATGESVQVRIAYAFQPHPEFDGWMPDQGVSFLWPYFCGNLFPCKSDPADGQVFTMAVTGAGDGLTAVYPSSIPAEAPTYMPAVAVADFTKVDLGTTDAGTHVYIWHLPGQAADAAAGTAHLRAVFDFYEKTYGPYTFGDEVGTVSADWGGGDYGGMEHHPFWHVSSGSIYSEEVNAHEAAHGWYGDGVRIACWEDFVLSEGTATYLSARALGQQGVDIWPDFECELKYYCSTNPDANTIALPSTCDQIDILHDPLWSGVPYMKGAFFYKKVARKIGADALDADLAAFYQANVGKAASMNALIEAIQAAHPAQADAIGTLADKWLRQKHCPINVDTLCN